MNIFNKTFAIALLGCSISTAQAASISLQSASFRGGETGDLSSLWGESSSYLDSQLATFSDVRPGGHTINRLLVEFDSSQSDEWSFRFGLDGGYGAAFYMNGSLLSETNEDLWWRRNWENRDVMNLSDLFLETGTHLLEVYWAENCCNGVNSGQFTVDGFDWQELSVANLESSQMSAVPIPAAVWLFGTAFLGLLGMRSRQVRRQIAPQ